MRNFSNQNSDRPSGGARPSGGNSGRPQGGNRGGYGGNRSGGGGGGYNREQQGGRDNRGGGYRGPGNREGGNREGGHREGGYQGGYRGNNPRFERHDNRGEHRSSGPRSGPPNSPGNFRNDRSGRPERHEGPYTPRTGSSWVEVTGRTVEEAVEEAARRFNVHKNDLKTEVLEEGSKGFLGIGSKPSKVKISLKAPAVASFAEGVLSRLLRGMGLPDKVKVQKDEDGNTVLNILGPSSGTLIGRHGHTLEALQYLVSKTVQRMTGDEKSIIIVDVENYLERQKDKLKELAVNLAQKAKETGVEIPMRPMSSKDRRVVHMSLKEHEHVTTESRGEGLRRKVVIVPKVKAEVVTPEAAAAAEAAGNVGVESPAPMEDQPTVSVESQPVVERQPVVENQPISPAAKVEEPVASNHPEPGNAIPNERPIDDNIGNRV
jgi:spoIIIJ-associated protein